MTDPAAVARARVDDLLERLARVNLQVVVISPPDALRRSAQARARTAAIAAGRGQLFDEATAAVRDAALRAYSRGGYSGTWAATDWSISVARPDDRIAAAAAFEEAAMAEVVEDLVDDDMLEILRASTDELVRSSGMPSPGSLSALTDAGQITGRGTWSVGVAVLLVLLALGLFVAVGSGFGVVALVAIAIALAWRRSGMRP